MVNLIFNLILNFTRNLKSKANFSTLNLKLTELTILSNGRFKIKPTIPDRFLVLEITTRIARKGRIRMESFLQMGLSSRTA
jgi:hypothetical protein